MSRRIPLALLICTLPGIAQPAASLPDKKAGPAREDPFLNGPPLTFNDLNRTVGVVFEGRLRAAIDRRGIAGPLTDLQLKRLADAGAPKTICDLIRSKFKAPAQAPAMLATTGSLTLKCLPSECDILINGRPAGATAGGLLEVRGLTPGEAIVDFRKAGYISEQLTVPVQANVALVKAVKLNLSFENQKRVGAALLETVRAKVGPAAPAGLTMSGTAILWDKGQRTEWQANANISVQQQKLSLDIQGAGLKWRTALKNGNAKSDGSGKLKSTGLPLAMERLLHDFYDYQPAVLLTTLANRGVVILGDDRVDEQGNRILQAQSGADSYLILVAADGRPLKVQHGGVEIAYADFETVDGHVYPKTFSTRSLAANAPPANTLHFNLVAADPKESARK